MNTEVEMTGPHRVRIARPVVHYIKEWRKYRGHSLDSLAKLSKVSPSMISQLERGKTSYTQTTLEALAKELHVEPWQLLVCKDPENEADLWRIIATLDQDDMKTVLREYASKRSLIVETYHPVAGR
jgi:transcriptional regulator with XRE-family HTH domain